MVRGADGRPSLVWPTLLDVAKTPDADRQAREYIDRVVESHRKNGYGLRLSKKRYEEAVGRVAETFRGLIDARKPGGV
jgi:hypothetical protein